MKKFLLFAAMASLCLAACSARSVAPAAYRNNWSASAMESLHKAITKYNSGCMDSAMENLDRAHALFTLADDQRGIAMCMNNMGNVYMFMGEPSDAIALFDEAFSIYSAIGDTAGALQALANKAAALIREGRYEEAGAILEMAEKFAPGASGSCAPVLNNRGVLLTKLGKLGEAEKILKKALSCIDPDRLDHVATVNASLGHLMKKEGRNKDALAFFKKAYEADRQAECLTALADDLASMSECAISLGNYTDGIDWLKRSTKLYALTGKPIAANNALKKLVSLAREQNMDITVTRHFVSQWLKEGGRDYCN